MDCTVLKEELWRETIHSPDHWGIIQLASAMPVDSRGADPIAEVPQP